MLRLIRRHVLLMACYGEGRRASACIWCRPRRVREIRSLTGVASSTTVQEPISCGDSICLEFSKTTMNASASTSFLAISRHASVLDSESTSHQRAVPTGLRTNDHPGAQAEEHFIDLSIASKASHSAQCQNKGAVDKALTSGEVKRPRNSPMTNSGASTSDKAPSSSSSSSKSKLRVKVGRRLPSFLSYSWLPTIGRTTFGSRAVANGDVDMRSSAPAHADTSGLGIYDKLILASFFGCLVLFARALVGAGTHQTGADPARSLAIHSGSWVRWQTHHAHAPSRAELHLKAGVHDHPGPHPHHHHAGVKSDLHAHSAVDPEGHYSYALEDGHDHDHDHHALWSGLWSWGNLKKQTEEVESGLDQPLSVSNSLHNSMLDLPYSVRAFANAPTIFNSSQWTTVSTS